MLILTEFGGQTSNHFFQYTGLDSYCKQHKIKFLCLPILQYLDKYPQADLLTKNRNIYRVFSFIAKILTRISSKNLIQITNSKDAIELLKNPSYFKNKLVFCKGWYLWEPQIFIDSKPHYENTLQPKVNKQLLNDSFFSSDAEEIVHLAVHIRRGDYKYFLNGLHYHEDEVYIKHIINTVKQITNPINIILFTNDDDLDFEKYKTTLDMCHSVKLSKLSVEDDYYLMSKCDYLLGTSSTFTLWAAYLGTCKLFHFLRDTEYIHLSEFTCAKTSVYKWLKAYY